MNNEQKPRYQRVRRTKRETLEMLIKKYSDLLNKETDPRKIRLYNRIHDALIMRCLSLYAKLGLITNHDPK